MNYKQIITDGYIEERKDGTPYTSYFKREAKNNNQQKNVEYADFFKGCKRAIAGYKKNIEDKYYKELSEIDEALSYYAGLKYVVGNIEFTAGEIQDRIDCIEEHRKYVEQRGCKQNDNCFCGVTEAGEIAKWMTDDDPTALYNMKYKLYYSDIEKLEQAIIQAEREVLLEQERTKTPQAGAGKPQKNFSDYLPVDKKDEIIEVLSWLLSKETSGKKVAMILEALQIKNYLIVGAYKVPEVIAAFDIRCSDTGINKYLNKKKFEFTSGKGEIEIKQELRQIIEILP